MKPFLAPWLLLLLFCAALPISAEDKDAEEPKEDTILGTWYVQTAMGEILPEGEMKLEFTEDGTVKAFAGDEEANTTTYAHDAENTKLTIYREDDPDEIEAHVQYSFVDEVLILISSEGEGEDKEVVVIELTRNPEGSKRHQEKRKEADKNGGLHNPRDEARRMQSATQLRGLHQGAVIFATSNKGNYPTSLGEMLPADLFTPEYVLSPWSKTEVPEDIDDWDDEEKIEWVNKNTDYVYLLAGRTEQLDTQLIALFEIPRSADQPVVRVLYEDNHTSALSYEEADKAIKKQTGHTLQEWMKTTTPGTGKITLPEKEEAEAE